jgi:hypothetical protein
VKLPETLALNAFTGEGAVAGAVADQAERWGSLGTPFQKLAPMAPAAPVDLADWRHPCVGWGIVLPERDERPASEKGRAVDAPIPIQRLLEDRPDAPVLRYRRSDLGVSRLIRYFPDGSCQEPEIGLSKFGVERGRLPLYLLIVGSPAEIPWRLQYSLNRRHRVGRLDLPEAGLHNYVEALLSDWADVSSDPARPLLWSVNNDSITNKMETTIVSQVEQALRSDPDRELTVNWVRGESATCPGLTDALQRAKPSVIVTSSHGKTGPLNDASAMRATLGLPVDINQQTLDIDTLLGSWDPSGAIWLDQACCSAGSDSETSYARLLQAGSPALEVLNAVAQLGAATAPLPSRLLGVAQPLRAFVGHVEPTFDWTLLAQHTGQYLTGPLVDAVYPNLFLRWPLGMALDGYYRGVGDLYSKLNDARQQIDNGVAGARVEATYYRLTATDRESMVILGDPTTVIPLLPSQR